MARHTIACYPGKVHEFLGAGWPRGISSHLTKLSPRASWGDTPAVRLACQKGGQDPRRPQGIIHHNKLTGWVWQGTKKAPRHLWLWHYCGIKSLEPRLNSLFRLTTKKPWEPCTSHYQNQRWLDYQHIYVSLGLNELNETRFSNIHCVLRPE